MSPVVTCLLFLVLILSWSQSHRRICTFWSADSNSFVPYYLHSVLSSCTVLSPVICTVHPSATSSLRSTQFNPPDRRAELDVFHINKWCSLSCGHYLGYMQILPVCIRPCTSWALIKGIKAKTAGGTEGMEWFFCFVVLVFCRSW